MKALVHVVITLMISAADITQGVGENIEDRIYNGYIARKGQFPYIAKIANTESSGNKSDCTGQILSDRWIMAAGHCVTDVISATVYLGLVTDFIFFNNTDPVLIYTIPKENLFQHPDYNGDNQNDISLYKLPVSAPVNRYPHIKTIALPKKSDMRVAKFDNQNATAAGWGAYNDTTPITHALRFAPVHIMNHADCIKQLEAALPAGNIIPDNVVCTDKTVFYHGACPGDSGGPLIVKGSDGKVMTIGAAAFILGDCSNKNPVVYTFVPMYLDWISKTTGIPIRN